jgi:hypothetical protein
MLRRAVLCRAVLQVPGSLTSSMVDDVFFILKKSSSRALATQVRRFRQAPAAHVREPQHCHDFW